MSINGSNVLNKTAFQSMADTRKCVYLCVFEVSAPVTLTLAR